MVVKKNQQQWWSEILTCLDFKGQKEVGLQMVKILNGIWKPTIWNPDKYRPIS